MFLVNLVLTLDIGSEVKKEIKYGYGEEYVIDKCLCFPPEIYMLKPQSPV